MVHARASVDPVVHSRPVLQSRHDPWKILRTSRNLDPQHSHLHFWKVSHIPRVLRLLAWRVCLARGIVECRFLLREDFLLETCGNVSHMMNKNAQAILRTTPAQLCRASSRNLDQCYTAPKNPSNPCPSQPVRRHAPAKQAT